MQVAIVAGSIGLSRDAAGASAPPAAPVSQRDAGFFLAARPGGYAFNGMPNCSAGFAASVAGGYDFGRELTVGADLHFAHVVALCSFTGDRFSSQHLRLAVSAGGGGRFGRWSGHMFLLLGPTVRGGQPVRDGLPRWGFYSGLAGDLRVELHPRLELGLRLEFGLSWHKAEPAQVATDEMNSTRLRSRGPGPMTPDFEPEPRKVEITTPVALLPSLRLRL